MIRVLYKYLCFPVRFAFLLSSLSALHDSLLEYACFLPYCCASKWAFWFFAFVLPSPSPPTLCEPVNKMSTENREHRMEIKLVRQPACPPTSASGQHPMSLLSLQCLQEEKLQKRLPGLQETGWGGIQGAGDSCMFISERQLWDSVSLFCYRTWTRWWVGYKLRERVIFNQIRYCQLGSP